ncbi:hypothetical protein D1970_08895 [Mesobacillus zeae]|uniref:Uncharacterized protein n=2 Tax=Mesobacillus zeae TaxID=1917180 RepID=A0A398B826_9BACI|nr:hypothetical protein D1970_08895 [Mesobacillus zeae]
MTTKIYTVTHVYYDETGLEIATHDEQKAIETFKKDEDSVLNIWENDKRVLSVYRDGNELHPDFHEDKTAEKLNQFHKIKTIFDLEG